MPEIFIPLQAGIQEIESILRDARVGLRQGYAVDVDFSRWVLAPIASVEQAFDFLATLERDCYMAHPHRICAKARSARRWLEGRDDFWIQGPERIRTVIAHASRVGCACHETGSFMPYVSPFSPATPKQRVRAIERAAMHHDDVDRHAIYHEAHDPPTLLGVGKTPAAAWADADRNLLERHMKVWWAGGTGRMEPALQHPSGLSPTLATARP